MAQPRTDATIEHRARELRKIADRLLALADEIERQEATQEQIHQRRAMKANRMNRSSRIASRLLMETLAVGGPEDEQLRIILLIWKDKQCASILSFEHVFRTWKPLLVPGFPQSMSNMLAWARALRIIAEGVAPQSPEDA